MGVTILTEAQLKRSASRLACGLRRTRGEVLAELQRDNARLAELKAQFPGGDGEGDIYQICRVYCAERGMDFERTYRLWTSSKAEQEAFKQETFDMFHRRR